MDWKKVKQQKMLSKQGQFRISNDRSPLQQVTSKQILLIRKLSPNMSKDMLLNLSIVEANDLIKNLLHLKQSMTRNKP